MDARLKTDGWRVALVALAARLALVAWAAGRIPPTADGEYYHTLAARLAEGAGYTWLWPDGVVTYAAHYPVGYPAAVAGVYALVGSSPAAAMALNALVGALAALAIQRVLARFRHRHVALLGGLAVALHPGLVGYTPALMTEGFAAALVACALWAALAARERRDWDRWLRLTATGLVLGAATLVRPQCLLLAPLLGLVACPRSATLRKRANAALVVGALATSMCLPWTVRNCERMGRCALVSVNGGWNLLIGTSREGRGGWAPLETPPACRTVFDEAEKDRCFEEAAVQRIGEAPLAWLRLADDKLAVTFDYCGAAGWYLHAANAGAFPERAKLVLGAFETVYERLALVFALLACWPGSRRARRSWRMALVLVGMGMALTRFGWIAHLMLMAALWPRRRSGLHAGALAVLASVALVHVVFFGAGRYQLLVLPPICALGALGVMRFAARLRRWRRR